MVEVTRDQIREACWDAGLDADEAPYWDYSGKAMYGATCFGLQCDEGQLLEFTISLARQDEGMDLEWLRKVRSDSMGLGSIFYWPGVTIPGEGEDAED